MGSVTLVALPYDSGRFNERMGRGPLDLIEGGLGDRLRAHQHDVEVVTHRLSVGFHTEATALVELQKMGAATVRDLIARNRRPILLSGNCGPAALSAVSGLGSEPTGVIWFDAHADFNTPDTSSSGFLDGMSLSILTGYCWPALAARFTGFNPVLAGNVILIGARDFDPAEAATLSRSEITRIGPELSGLEQAVKTLSGKVPNFYVHLDVDVLDDSEGRANSYACGGGLSAQNLYAALNLLRQPGRIKAASITSYDPACDAGGTIRAIIENAASLLID